ncbi:hypothetical protein BGZ60DRAFT_117024 [Tricladium varicosporioides]|nr:hypothetical protein BGZ60DRAFT_117024 [Hymenoscyphus varicosporioides]
MANVVAANGSFASPLADAKYAQIVGNPQIDSIIAKVSNLSGWTIALTVLALLIAYDQSTYGRKDLSLVRHSKFHLLVRS